MPGGFPKNTTTAAIGAAGEQRAARFLERQGVRIIERNFRVKGGEIDLVCRQADTILFVEVRLRSRKDYGGAAASITSSKQRRLILAARHWLHRHGDLPCRFDALLINGPESSDIEWIPGAFSAD